MRLMFLGPTAPSKVFCPISLHTLTNTSAPDAFASSAMFLSSETGVLIWPEIHMAIEGAVMFSSDWGLSLSRREKELYVDTEHPKIVSLDL